MILNKSQRKISLIMNDLKKEYKMYFCSHCQTISSFDLYSLTQGSPSTSPHILLAVFPKSGHIPEQQAVV